MEYIQRIDQMGGMVRAVEEGYPQREIARSAYEHERALASGERVVVGVNRFRSPEQEKIPTLRIDESVAREQLAELARVKAGRSATAGIGAVAALRRAAGPAGNQGPPDAAGGGVDGTEGENGDVVRDWIRAASDPRGCYA